MDIIPVFDNNNLVKTPLNLKLTFKPIFGEEVMT